eukprot:3941201-Rhodomonas_salina.9
MSVPGMRGATSDPKRLDLRRRLVAAYAISLTDIAYPGHRPIAASAMSVPYMAQRVRRLIARCAMAVPDIA